MRILITGHTGFKGSWLSLLLNEMGHEVSGLALEPESQSNFEVSRVAEVINHDIRGDIRELNSVAKAVERANPEFVFHLAAQPLVKEGYRNPKYTYEVNVNGTLHILESVQNSPNVKGLLVITTDKVYSNNTNAKHAFTEEDPLGFGDPYSTSKAMADLLTQSWMQNSRIPIGIARAGNVVGGGDFGANRLIPDLIRDSQVSRKTQIRYAKSVRPWQYVLDCLGGYVLQMQSILSGESSILNFGPDHGDYYEVEQVANSVSKRIEGCGWEKDPERHPHEASFLTLDSSKAMKLLKWNNKYSLEDTLDKTADWYRFYVQGVDMSRFSRNQVKEYLR